MQWRTFHQASVPEMQTFILALGNDIFFAKIFDKKIITKYAYSDADKFTEHTLRRSGVDLEVFMNNWARRGIAPLWAHFHKPGSFE